MKSHGRLVAIALLLLGAVAGNAMLTLADGGGPRGGGLSSLRRALTQANAPALTTAQETQIATLVTAYRDALPDDDDDALEAARDAFNAAVLAGNAAGAQAQATIIANLAAAHTRARLLAEAQFEIAVLALLRSGGQLNPLVTQFGNDRVLSIIDGLIGGGPGGGGPGGGRH